MTRQLGEAAILQNKYTLSLAADVTFSAKLIKARDAMRIIIPSCNNDGDKC